MSDSNMGPWGPRLSNDQRPPQPKLSSQLPQSKGMRRKIMPLLTVVTVGLTGLMAGVVIDGHWWLSDLAEERKLHPTLPFGLALKLAGDLKEEAQQTDRLERCVQDGMGLESFAVVGPEFKPKTKDLKFVLNNVDHKTSLAVDTGQTVMDDAALRRPWHYALAACQHYVYDGDWQAARKAIQYSKFKPERLLIGG